MRFKNALILTIILLFTSTGFSQIQIDDVGDGWKMKVDSALELISKTDPVVYKEVKENCKHISYWMGKFSTTQDSTTILISTSDMRIGSINNLACVIVHEAHHLYIKRNKIVMMPRKEEYVCYLHEYDFLKKLSNPEDWLTIHVIKCVMKFKD